MIYTDINQTLFIQSHTFMRNAFNKFTCLPNINMILKEIMAKNEEPNIVLFLLCFCNRELLFDKGSECRKFNHKI